MVSLGDRVRAARVRAEMTQAQFERATGIPTNSLSRIENGRYQPSIQVLARISDALDVTMDELVHGATPGTADDPVVRKTLREMNHLSPKSRKVVLDLALSLRRRER